MQCSKLMYTSPSVAKAEKIAKFRIQSQKNTRSFFHFLNCSKEQKLGM
jgi:hypothetical protein